MNVLNVRDSSQTRGIAVPELTSGGAIETINPSSFSSLLNSPI